MSEKPLLTQSVHSDGATKRAVTREQMNAWVEQLVTRRSVLAGATTLSLAGLAGLVLGGCDGEQAATGPPGPTPPGSPEFNFKVVPMNAHDKVAIPEGYRAHVLYAYGDPISPDLDAYSNMGTEPASEWDHRAGDHHDGMHFFGLNDSGELDPNASNRGILCINHENVTLHLMHDLQSEQARNSRTYRTPDPRTSVDEVRKEQRAHGVSCIEVVRDEASGQFMVVADSPCNRRITVLTPVELHGPAAGSDLLKTKFSPDGMESRGTLNNCANGYTPWGTYLTCEENYRLYFRYDSNSRGTYKWETLAGHAEETEDEFSRFDVEPKGGSATDDFRNEANQFGYIVEIDPLDPEAPPRKRTALGRFAHEGVWPARMVEGEPLVFYMGDDARFQCIYKFVSAKSYTVHNAGTPLAVGDAYLNEGTLYVARFDIDELTNVQTGEWIALDMNNQVLVDAGFDSLASILVNARDAALAVGATPMDRPEWGAVNPQNGEVYFTLTNNTRRTTDQKDAANPRGPNPDGHILRIRENGNDPSGTRFAWDIFLFGSGKDSDMNFSSLTADNEFTDCDGLWFDAAGLLWIQTDGGQPGGNHNQMLAAVPGEVDDGGIDAGNNVVSLRRFLVGPIGCEITGIDMTPDRRSMFVNIQHPDEDGYEEGTTKGHWPVGDDATVTGTAGLARSATIVITRENGGPIGTDGMDG